VVKCGIRKQYIIKDPNSEETIVPVRNELNTVHRKFFDTIKEAMTTCDTLVTLLVDDSALARMCTKYDADTKFTPDIFKKVNNKVNLLSDMLPVVVVLHSTFNQQGSVSASTTSSGFGALTNTICENEKMTVHQTRMRESAEKILEMQFTDLKTFLDSVQTFFSYTKMCTMCE